MRKPLPMKVYDKKHKANLAAEALALGIIKMADLFSSGPAALFFMKRLCIHLNSNLKLRIKNT